MTWLLIFSHKSQTLQLHDLSVSADFFSGNSPACINCYEKENKTITYQKQEYRTHDNASVVSVG